MRFKYNFKFNPRVVNVFPVKWKKRIKKKKNKITVRTYFSNRKLQKVNLKLRLRKPITRVDEILEKAFDKLKRRNLDLLKFRKLKKIRRIKKRKRKLLKRKKKPFFKNSIFNIYLKRKKKRLKRKKKPLKRQIRYIKKSIRRKFNYNRYLLKHKNLTYCYVNLKQTFNNFFIVLTDIKGKVISYISAGQVSDSNNIKRKRSYFLVYPMMNILLFRLRKLKIKNIRVKIRSNVTQHIRKVIQFLDNRGFLIQHIFMAKPLPHHFGRRRKKLRRV